MLVCNPDATGPLTARELVSTGDEPLRLPFCRAPAHSHDDTVPAGG